MPERLLPRADRGAAQALLAAGGHGHRGPRRRRRARARGAGPRPGLRRPLRPAVRGPRPALRPEGEEGGVARGEEPPRRDRGQPLAASCGGCSSASASASSASARPCSSPGTSAASTRSRRPSVEAIDDIYEIGPVVAESVHAWFQDPANRRLVERLKDGAASASRRARPGRLARAFQGMQFVLTGTLDVDDARRGEGGDREPRGPGHVLGLEEDVGRGRGPGRRLEARQGEGARRRDVDEAAFRAMLSAGVKAILPLMTRAASVLGLALVAFLAAALGYLAGGGGRVAAPGSPPGLRAAPRPRSRRWWRA